MHWLNVHDLSCCGNMFVKMCMVGSVDGFLFVLLIQVGNMHGTHCKWSVQGEGERESFPSLRCYNMVLVSEYETNEGRWSETQPGLLKFLTASAVKFLLREMENGKKMQGTVLSFSHDINNTGNAQRHSWIPNNYVY